MSTCGLYWTASVCFSLPWRSNSIMRCRALMVLCKRCAFSRAYLLDTCLSLFFFFCFFLAFMHTQVDPTHVHVPCCNTHTRWVSEWQGQSRNPQILSCTGGVWKQLPILFVLIVLHQYLFFSCNFGDRKQTCPRRHRQGCMSWKTQDVVKPPFRPIIWQQNLLVSPFSIAVFLFQA